jgi:hypothetical protein
MMKETIIFLLLMIHASLPVSAQQSSSENFYEAHQVDSLPRLSLNGRIVPIEEFVDQQMRWEAGMQEGEKVVVSFVVDTKGSVVALELLDIPRHCDLCLKEYVRVLTSMPPLIPAFKGGVPVNVQLRQVTYFKIKR